MTMTSGVWYLKGIVVCSAIILVDLPSHANDERGWTDVEQFVWQELKLGKHVDLEFYAGDKHLSENFIRDIVSDPDLIQQIPATDGVHISSAIVDEKLDLADRTIPFRFELERSKFKQDVILRNTLANDSVSFAGSQFCSLLDLDQMEIERHLSLTNAILLDTRMRNATIGGYVDMSGAMIHGLLNLRRTTIGKYLLMDNSVHEACDNKKEANCETILHAVSVGETISARKARFLRSLQMRRADIKLGLQFVNMTATESIILHNASIGGNFSLTGGHFSDVNLTGASISGELRLVSNEHEAAKWYPDSELILRNAKVRSFQDPTILNAWPARLNLTGFEYELVGGYAASDSYDEPDKLMEWLGRQTCQPNIRPIRDTDKAACAFVPQPYLQLAEILDAMGYTETARRVRFEERQRTRQSSGGLKRANLTMQYLLVGYGYAYWPSFVLTIFLATLGTLLISRDSIGAQMSWFERSLFSFDRLVPAVKLRNADYASDPGGLIGYYFYFHTFLGYVVAGYLLASLF